MDGALHSDFAKILNHLEYCNENSILPTKSDTNCPNQEIVEIFGMIPQVVLELVKIIMSVPSIS